MEPDAVKEGDSSVQNAEVQQNSKVADGAERSSSTSQVNLLAREEVQQSTNVLTWLACWPLCKMIQENDWKGIEDFVGDHPEALTQKIANYGKTIFHQIINYCHDDVEGAACLLEKLAPMVHPTILEQKDNSDTTVLTSSAIRGNTRASKVLVKYNSNLPDILCQNFLPVQVAAEYGHKDTVQYLIQVTAVENLKGFQGAQLLSRLIKSNLYDMALDLLKRFPEMGRDHIRSRNFVLETLIEKPLAFASGSKLGRLQRFIYNRIPVTKEDISSIDQTNKNQNVGTDVENLIMRSKEYPTKLLVFGSLRQIATTCTIFSSIFRELHMMFWNALLLLVPCIKVIREQKLTHKQTVEIIQMICEGVVWNDPEVFNTVLSLRTAASFGISEFVNEIIMAYNESVYWTNYNNGCNVFHLAVLYRREKVFNLIYSVRFLNDMLATRDNSSNNMLHLAGILLEPSSEVAGAALQMQRELQWFKVILVLFCFIYMLLTNGEKIW